MAAATEEELLFQLPAAKRRRVAPEEPETLAETAERLSVLPFEPSDSEYDFANLSNEEQLDDLKDSLSLISSHLQQQIRDTEPLLRESVFERSQTHSSMFTESRPLLVFANDLDALTTQERRGEMEEWKQLPGNELDQKHPLRNALQVELLYDPDRNLGLMGISEGHHRLLRLEELAKDHDPEMIPQLLVPVRLDVHKADVEQEAERHPDYQLIQPPEPLVNVFGYIPRREVTPYDIGMPTVLITDYLPTASSRAAYYFFY